MKTHRAFGVYGVCYEEGRLLVINKSRGPYINRFDLPGGSLEESEGLIEALKREFTEETGFICSIADQIGTADFIFPCAWKDFTHVHHIAVFYSVKRTGGERIEPLQFDGQDSLGAEWVSAEEASIDNASPLVMKALDWLGSGALDWETKIFKRWDIKEPPV
ncbi:NUDIX domain-containing protein [Bacillus salacetis]|uniref:NUDIX domain-containing protein n=1 Tax=Bacillus salacetis TaxID=2315464 RepID=A0A3A1R359_9BACI|nr:NUDIX hydrolase [Bacillus salacetis]RIW34012.1 NUDIX domain-containing protein [Bacillus salacetis]